MKASLYVIYISHVFSRFAIIILYIFSQNSWYVRKKEHEYVFMWFEACVYKNRLLDLEFL